MGLITLPAPILLTPLFPFGSSGGSNTIDAAGESVAFIFRVRLEAGSGSKTISAAGGGKIAWQSGTSITFANAGTTLRIGIQDVSTTTGLEDTTYDVYADLVGGTDTIASNTGYATTMESGSKTIAHGDIIAVVFEATSRGGADSINVFGSGVSGYLASGPMFPYKTVDTGSGPTKSITNGGFGGYLRFDDGTIGWGEGIGTMMGLVNGATTISFHVNSVTDEYAAVFKVPFKCSICAVAQYLTSVAAADTYEAHFYTDPLGTPVAAITLTPDNDLLGSTGGVVVFSLGQSYTLQKDTWYAFSIRPTTTNTLSFGYYQLGTGFSEAKKIFPFGMGVGFYGRANQSGAFSQLTDNSIPAFGIFIDKLHNGINEHASPF